MNMKIKTVSKGSLSKGWEKILPVKGYPKMKHREGGDTEWIYKALGWKKK